MINYHHHHLANDQIIPAVRPSIITPNPYKHCVMVRRILHACRFVGSIKEFISFFDGWTYFSFF